MYKNIPNTYGHVVSILACHNTEACPATEYTQWKNYLQQHAEEYPPEPLIAAIAARLGATV